MRAARLFPDDTRLAEISSAWCLVCVALLALVGAVDLTEFVPSKPPAFWALLCGVLAGLQLGGVLMWPGAALVRVLSAWVAGVLLLWLACEYLHAGQGVAGAALLTLAVGDLYSVLLRAGPDVLADQPLDDFDDAAEEVRRAGRLRRWIP